MKDFVNQWTNLILRDDFRIDENRITPDANLIDDLRLDYLDIIEIVMTLEEECNIEISDSEIGTFKQVKDITNYLRTKFKMWVVKNTGLEE